MHRGAAAAGPIPESFMPPGAFPGRAHLMWGTFLRIATVLVTNPRISMWRFPTDPPSPRCIVPTTGG